VPARDLTGQLVSDSEPGSILADDKPTTKYTLSKEARARKALRVAELTRQGYSVVDNGCWLAVFNVR
jgi:hypothetical protein